MALDLRYPVPTGGPWVARRLRAADVPALYASCGERWHVPLTALVREWEWWPSERAAIIADEPQGADDDTCRIAAIVHALCDRDGVPIPDWVWRHRWPEPISWTRELPTDGPAWERTIKQSPAACAYHNVWFGEALISDPKTQAEAHRHARRTL